MMMMMMNPNSKPNRNLNPPFNQHMNAQVIRVNKKLSY